MSARGAVLGVDVGGTTVRGAVVPAGAGAAPIVARVETGARRGPDAVAAVVLDLVEGLVGRAGERGVAVTGAAVATLGVVDESAGVVRASTIGWRDLPLARLVAERTASPVRLVNDVRSGARAELDLGAGAGLASFAFAAVGTGLSVALVLGGEVHGGDAWAAGEVGQPAFGPAGEPLERRCSCRTVEARYAEATGCQVPASEVLRRAAGGEDPVATAVRDDAVAALAHALSWVVTVGDPGPIVVGGGLGEAGEHLLVPLAAALDRALGWRPAPRLRPAALGDRAGLVGALLHAADVAHLSPADLHLAGV